MACGWRVDKSDGFRFYVPECWGGLYDKRGCYCASETGKLAMINRIEKLEQAVKALSHGLTP